MSVDLYIYYRVGVERETVFREKAAGMQQSLVRRCGIVAELKRRPDPKDGLHTWMEVYYAVPANFHAALADALKDAGLAELIDGDRHTESFLDCSPCA